jgi:hypothetical protein
MITDFITYTHTHTRHEAGERGERKEIERGERGEGREESSMWEENTCIIPQRNLTFPVFVTYMHGMRRGGWVLEESI